MKKLCALLLCLLFCLSTETVLAAKPVPKDISYLLGLYYGNGSRFLIRENGGRLELVYAFDGEDRDFSGANIFPLKKEHFDSYTLNEEGPILSAEVAVRFERDVQGRGITCSIGGKRFSRFFYPGQNNNPFYFPAVGNYEALATAAASAVEPPALQKGKAATLVNLAALPNVKLDLRYATSNNCFGKPLYTEAKAYGAQEVAQALGRVTKKLQPYGYGLLIWDAYRPWSASKLAVDLLPADKKSMLPAPAKGSEHNTGLAVDVSLYDLATGTAVTMISDFDEVSPRQYTGYAGSTTQLRALRDLVQTTMQAAGFKNSPGEWWHFTYGDLAGYQYLNIPWSELQ